MTDLIGGRDAMSDGVARSGGIARRGAGASDLSRAGLDYTPLERTGAFKTAGRHTARVKFLRRAIILGAAFSVSIIAIVAAFDPFRHLPRGVSISSVGVAGTKITMDDPKISGVQQGGGPYDVKAKHGIQDITKPGEIELVDVDAHIGMADATTTHVLADHGHYDSKQDRMNLAGNVKIASTSGYTLGLKSALVDFKQGSFTSEERMRVDLKGGNVRSDTITISNEGHKIVFRGHVESTFDAPDEPEQADAGQPDAIAAVIDESR